MPYKLSSDGLQVEKEDGTPVGKKHNNKAEALAHLRALEANVGDAKSMKQYMTPTDEPCTDIRAAANALMQVTFLAEAEEAEADDRAEIVTIMRNLCDFIMGEIDEYETGQDEDDANESQEMPAMMSASKADFPWDECIAKMEKEYGDKETANKVCGKIRAGKSWAILDGELIISQKELTDVTKSLQRNGGLLNVSYIKSLGVSKPADYFRDVLAVKSIGKDSIKGYIALWGNPAVTDIESEYFTKSTDFWDSVLSFPRPLTWNHGQDRNVIKSLDTVGQIQSFADDDIGRFYEATLDRSHKYRKAIDALIGQRVIGTSSDSAPQYVIREKTGKATWLKQWPLFAGALTDVPCEPRMMGSVDFKSLGVDLDALVKQAEAARKALREDDSTELKNAMRLHDLLKLS